MQEQITTCGQNAIVKIGERTNIRPQKQFLAVYVTAKKFKRTYIVLRVTEQPLLYANNITVRKIFEVFVHVYNSHFKNIWQNLTQDILITIIDEFCNHPRCVHKHFCTCNYE